MCSFIFTFWCRFQFFWLLSVVGVTSSSRLYQKFLKILLISIPNYTCRKSLHTLILWDGICSTEVPVLTSWRHRCLKTSTYCCEHKIFYVIPWCSGLISEIYLGISVWWHFELIEICPSVCLAYPFQYILARSKYWVPFTYLEITVTFQGNLQQLFILDYIFRYIPTSDQNAVKY